jgi:hypothetical protein
MTQQELKEMMKAAMKNREAAKLSVVRGLLTSITNDLVQKGRGPDGVLTEDEIQTLTMRAAKQRKDSIEQFTKGGRLELAVGEQEELAIIAAMLPVQMTEAEIEVATKAKAAEMGITDKTKANQLMGALMKDLKGKADGTLVKAAVERLFA